MLEIFDTGQGSHLLVSTEVTRTNAGLLSIPMVGTEVALPSLSITGEHCYRCKCHMFQMPELLACLPVWLQCTACDILGIDGSCLNCCLAYQLMSSRTSALAMLLCQKVQLKFGMIAESSEGLLGGQKPPLQLVFRAMDEHGQRIRAILPLLSDEFVVGPYA